MSLPYFIPPALDAMRKYAQWICWDLVDRGGPKPAKVPTDPRTRRAIDPHQQPAWMTADEASTHAMLTGLGVGFVFTADDPFFFLDVDGCVTGGQWNPLALHLLSLLPGAAAETSVSRAGLHVFGRCPGGFTPSSHSNRNPLGLELYTSGRFAAIGYGATGDAGTDCTEGFHRLVADYFPPREATGPGAWTTEPVNGRGVADDDALLELALARSRDGHYAISGHPSFRELWEGDEAALGACFPDDAQGRAYDPSRADAALARELAYYAGGDCEQVERIMLRCEALRRPKWDERPDTYVRPTVAGAVAYKVGREELYRGAPPPPAPVNGTTSTSAWVLASEISPRPIEWLWTHWLPRGEVVLLESRYKVGKSTIAREIVAALSVGRPLPGGLSPTVPARSIWISTEEDAARSIVPGLEAAGANRDLVTLRREDAPWTVAGAADLTARIRSEGAVLVVIDALKDVLELAAEERETDVRGAMRRLLAVARETGACIVGIRHWKKGASTAADRGAGSVAYGAVTSATLAVIDDKESDRLVLSRVVGRFGKTPRGLAVRLVDRGSLPSVEWLGEVEDGFSADDHAWGKTGATEQTSPKMDAAMAYLQDALSRGARLGIDIHRGAPGSPRTIEAAKKKLGIISVAQRNSDGKMEWWWKLPGE